MTALLVITAVLVAWILLSMIATERDRRMQHVQAQARREAARLRAQQRAKQNQILTVGSTRS